jgi:hypothetical protein
MTNRTIASWALLGAMMLAAWTSANAALLAFLPFDGTANDVSGNANHGATQNGATFAAGFEGQALSLDGIDDWWRSTSMQAHCRN